MPLLDRLANDLRVAARGLARRPVFTAVAGLTLAAGIGANTAIFSVINGVLLRPLPYPASEELVRVNVAPNRWNHGPGSMSYPDLADLRDEGRSFRSLVGVNSSNMTLTGVGDPIIIEVTRVTEGLLSTFGAAPVLGRDLRRDEFGSNAPTVVVMGHAFWQERLGGSPDVLGKTIVLNGVSYEIVGIAPAGFEYPAHASLWILRSLDLDGCGRGCHTMDGVGRLASGVSLDAAAAELERFAINLEAGYPETNTDKRFIVRTLKATIVGDVEAGLWIMLAAVGLVLLIACANVANLLLARASAREGEIAVRAALGATRSQLAGHVLTESAVLAAVGGGVGIGLAFGGVRLLRNLVRETIPRADLIGTDLTVLAVTVASIALVMFAIGSIPAFHVSRAAITDNLPGIGRGGASAKRTMRFRRALLAGEVALSASLLIVAGLLFRTFTQLYAVDVGFETRDVARFSLVLPEANYPTIERASQFYEALEAGIAALPGVEAVGTMFGQPLGRGHATGSLLVDGRPDPEPGQELEASVRSVTPGLLATLRIPLRRGRLLQPSDNRRDAEPVALVNEALARQVFPNEDPIGQRIRVTVDFDYGSPYWRVVGVVGDVRFSSLTESARADIYVPHALFGPLSTTVHVRTMPGGPAIMEPIRRMVRRLDPNVPIYRVEALEQVVRRETATTRLYLVLVGLFAVTAAALAAVGLYGVVSYLVVQRRREIGIRVALGARRLRIVGLVVRQGLQPAAIGLLVGIAVALAAGRSLESLLFGVQPRDPAVFIVAAALMAGVVVLAAALPAVRASGIDPAEVLHRE